MKKYLTLFLIALSLNLGISNAEDNTLSDSEKKKAGSTCLMGKISPTGKLTNGTLRASQSKTEPFGVMANRP